MNLIENHLKANGLLNEFVHKELNISYHKWHQFKLNPWAKTLTFEKLDKLADMLRIEPEKLVLQILKEKKDNAANKRVSKPKK